MIVPSLDQRLQARMRPERRPIMYQKWRDLLFLHWEADPDEIQATLPPGLTVDSCEGKAFLGVVPFYMRDIRPRFLPPLPGISNFLELNLRTYVFDARGTPGVWFYSLDANQRLAIRVAQRFFGLNYLHATMSAPRVDGFIEYSCHRSGTETAMSSKFVYRAGKGQGTAEEASLEFFLIERYILFSWDARKRRLYSGRVHHPPYALCTAEVNGYCEKLIELAGFESPHRPADHIIMSPGVDVEIFALKEIERVVESA